MYACADPENLSQGWGARDKCICRGGGGATRHKCDNFTPKITNFNLIFRGGGVLHPSQYVHEFVHFNSRQIMKKTSILNLTDVEIMHANPSFRIIYLHLVLFDIQII